jgi:hypothetical protein
MRRLSCVVLVCVLPMVFSAACRRENPAVVRAATATAVVEATVAAVQPTASAASRRARVVAGNLGVAATGISAGIQLWSRPGGVMAGGATMTGTVSDGAEVDVVGEAEFVGQKYFEIRDASKDGWIDGRFLQLE